MANINRKLELTNSGSDKTLRPYAVYCKLTTSFCQEWGVYLYIDIYCAVRIAWRRAVCTINVIHFTLKSKPI